MRFRVGEFEVTSNLDPAFFVTTLFNSPDKFSLHDDGFVQIVTFNSLMYLDALKISEFAQALKGADLLVAESSGIRWAAGFLYGLDVRILAGIDLLCGLFDASGSVDKPVSFYFLGGKPGVAERAAQNVLRRWPWVRIVGVRDGFGGLGEGLAGEAAACDEVARSDADGLVVALGSPRQELFIWRHRARLSAGRLKLAVGVGGALDVLAGDLTRAPRPIQHLGLEWLWRVLQEPRRRLPRIARLPKFVLEMIKLKLFHKDLLKYEP